MDIENIKIKLLSSYTKDDNGCWNWNKCLRAGYGAIKINGTMYSVHRISYQIFKSDPGELFVCHKCDNPKCFNPEHLFLGTHSDNMKDAYKKGRVVIPSGGGFKMGHVPFNKGLSDDQVIKIKKAIINKGNVTLKEIAERFEIKYQLIRDINAGRVYYNISI